MLTSKKQSRHPYKRGILLVTVIGGFLLLSLAATLALADTPVVTGNVTTGGFTQGASVPGSFSGAIGTTATLSNLTMAVSDLTGSGAGWNITITSTTLNYNITGTATPTALTPTPAPWPTNASQVASVAATCTTTCSNTSLTGFTTPVAIPAGVAPPTAVKFFSALVGTGEGVYTITPTITVVIPGYAKMGFVYTSTYTVTAAAGP
jgi:hypothetical protein